MLFSRSPDLEPSGARGSTGGWGLGAGHEESHKVVDDEEEDYPSDWDQTQVGDRVLKLYDL